jgi:hypothetical protein
MRPSSRSAIRGSETRGPNIHQLPPGWQCRLRSHRRRRCGRNRRRAAGRRVHCRTASDAATSLEQGCTCTCHERRTLTTRFVVPRNSQPPIDRSEPFGCGRILAPRIFHKPIGFHPHRGRVVPDLERVVESIARGTHVGDHHYRRLRGNRRSFETARAEAPRIGVPSLANWANDQPRKLRSHGASLEHGLRLRE